MNNQKYHQFPRCQAHCFCEPIVYSGERFLVTGYETIELQTALLMCAGRIEGIYRSRGITQEKYWSFPSEHFFDVVNLLDPGDDRHWLMRYSRLHEKDRTVAIEAGRFW